MLALWNNWEICYFIKKMDFGCSQIPEKKSFFSCCFDANPEHILQPSVATTMQQHCKSVEQDYRLYRSLKFMRETA